ncbi:MULTISPECIES: lipoyl domain-containing protein [Streptomyces]|uniref:lipoyl domain-containing protein n=1 Tax=Streptomyces TaxID=1883 RepID=UPI0029D370C8|nr:lipoyl domain-containing protein [Streptomyces sp. F8]MDX6757992.1 lipoyl domain-containing protein [Streptomyces sp. F8]
MSTTVRKRLSHIIGASCLIAACALSAGVPASPAQARASECGSSSEPEPSPTTAPGDEAVGITKIVMPSLGESATGGDVDWQKQVGDTVSKEETIAVVESAKVTMDLDSPVDGVLMEMCVADGGFADPGEILAVIGPPGTAPGTSE